MHYLTLLVRVMLLVVLMAFVSVSVRAVDISSVTPSANSMTADPTADIVITFDTDMDSSTFVDSTVIVRGGDLGLIAGSMSYNSVSRALTFNPTSDFRWGELITVVLTTGIKSSGSVALAGGRQYTFTIRVDGGSAGFDVTVYDSTTRFGVLLVDVDGDGNLDLVCPDVASCEIRLGDGDGTFGSPTRFQVPVYADEEISLASGDVDGDSDIDLVCAGNTSCALLLNDGYGDFTVADTLEYTGYLAGGAVLADCDMDGDLDIDIALEENSGTDFGIITFVNNGSGTFTSGEYQSAYDYKINDPVRVRDLVFMSPTGFSTIPQVAMSGYEHWAWYSTASSGTPPVYLFSGTYSSAYVNSLHPADLDGDGDLDLICGGEGRITAMLYDDGEFSALSSFGGQSEYVTGADFDGDGDIDIAASGIGTDLLTVFTNDGAADFTPRISIPIGCYGGYNHMTMGDIDNDGDIDLVVLSSSGTVSVLLNKCCCVPPRRGDIDAVGLYPKEIDVADLVYLTNWMFQSDTLNPGLPPPNEEEADVDGDDDHNIADLVYLVNFMFDTTYTSPEPVPCD